MKYIFMFRGLKMILSGITKKQVKDRTAAGKIGKTYREILERAGQMDPASPLVGAYGLAAWFISMNRHDGLSPEENCRILEEGLKNSRLYKAFMGSADDYFSEKKMEFRRDWAAKTQSPEFQKRFPNDWEVELLEKGPDYDFGFDYLQCGICKLCREEGCPELAEYLCRLDYMTSDLMGVGLRRTETLAEGSPKCDFRFYKYR